MSRTRRTKAEIIAVLKEMEAGRKSEVAVVAIYLLERLPAQDASLNEEYSEEIALQ